jgi:hypothetical protein
MATLRCSGTRYASRCGAARIMLFIEMDQDRIFQILVVGNPDKLRLLNQG